MEKHWQNTILSEWRNTWDEQYAFKLFGLVANEPASNISRIITILLGIFCGGLMGLAASFILPREFRLQEYLLFAGLGTIVGGLFATTKQNLTWHKFFALFIPEISNRILSRLNNFVIICLLLSIAGLLVGLFVSLLMAGPTYVLEEPFTFQKSGSISPVGFLVLILGPAFGLWLGNTIFKTGGWIVGVISGLGFVIGDKILMSLDPLSLPEFMDLSKGAFLIGLSVTGILFLDPKLSRVKDGLNPSRHRNLYRYRGWWTWWRQSPNYLDLETVIEQATKKSPQEQSEWIEILKHLKVRKAHKEAVITLVDSFKTGDWQERFCIRQILRKISWETQALTASTSASLLCTDCFIQIYPHKISLPGDHSYIFYGCRECQQYDSFLDELGAVVAVLNANMRESWMQNNGTLRVNWLKHRALFDFDEVEIIRATDEDVERFVVQVGNDTDAVRQPRYKQMNCVVTAEAKLSENSIRILQKTFNCVIMEQKYL